MIPESDDVVREPEPLAAIPHHVFACISATLRYTARIRAARDHGDAGQEVDWEARALRMSQRARKYAKRYFLRPLAPPDRVPVRSYRNCDTDAYPMRLWLGREAATHGGFLVFPHRSF
jgi:hypothetical protein